MTTPVATGDKRVAVPCPLRDKDFRDCIATHCIRRQCMAMPHKRQCKKKGAQFEGTPKSGYTE